MDIVIATATDPYYNLAVENYLFQNVLRNTPILYLWQNTPCVVIGRAQNPWRECHIEALNADKVPIVRRQSGGGTVYHDLGNLNYTILSPARQYDKKRNLQLIIEVLSTLGIRAFASAHHDILIKHDAHTYKISGSAFRETRDRKFHHGTLLIDADTEKLYRYLHHKTDEHLKIKGVKSRRAKVMNLSALYPNVTVKALLAAFCQQLNRTPVYLSLNLDREKSLQREIERLKSHEWRFGKTLPFERMIEIGEDQFIFHIKNGRIEDLNAPENYNDLKKWIQTHRPIYHQDGLKAFDQLHKSPHIQQVIERFEKSTPLIMEDFP